MNHDPVGTALAMVIVVVPFAAAFVASLQPRAAKLRESTSKTRQSLPSSERQHASTWDSWGRPIKE